MVGMLYFGALIDRSPPNFSYASFVLLAPDAFLLENPLVCSDLRGGGSLCIQGAPEKVMCAYNYRE